MTMGRSILSIVICLIWLAIALTLFWAGNGAWPFAALTFVAQAFVVFCNCLAPTR